jgi:preprotein translocase subunit SecE
MFGKISKFLNEVAVELKKVSWPTREELLASTWIVISITFILAVYVGTADFSLSKFLRSMIK